MDGETYGPYSAKAIRDLELLDDILVTEESMNGKWLPASKFDFDDMVRKEESLSISIPKGPGLCQGTHLNDDGTVTNPNGWLPQPQQYPPTPHNTTNNDDNSSPVGWCILSFLIPLVGWILYFSWRDTKPHKASAVCTWAWIGFVVNLIGAISAM